MNSLTRLFGAIMIYLSYLSLSTDILGRFWTISIELWELLWMGVFIWGLCNTTVIHNQDGLYKVHKLKYKWYLSIVVGRKLIIKYGHTKICLRLQLRYLAGKSRSATTYWSDAKRMVTSPHNVIRRVKMSETVWTS